MGQFFKKSDQKRTNSLKKIRLKMDQFNKISPKMDQFIFKKDKNGPILSKNQTKNGPILPYLWWAAQSSISSLDRFQKCLRVIIAVKLFSTRQCFSQRRNAASFPLLWTDWNLHSCTLHCSVLITSSCRSYNPTPLTVSGSWYLHWANNDFKNKLC